MLEAGLHVAVAVDLIGIAAVADAAVELPVARDQRPPGAHVHVKARRPGAGALVLGRARVGCAGDEPFGSRLPLAPPRAGQVLVDRGPGLRVGEPSQEFEGVDEPLLVLGPGAKAVEGAIGLAVVVTHGRDLG